MGNVALILKVMPESVDVDLDQLQNKIKETVDAKDFGLEDIAFGLKAIKVAMELQDIEGILDENLDKIRAIDGVQSVEVERMELL